MVKGCTLSIMTVGSLNENPLGIRKVLHKEEGLEARGVWLSQ